MSGAIPAILPGFIEEIDRLFGGPGHAWMRQLPALIEGALRHWSLDPDGEARHGARGLVLPVRQRGHPLALKVAYPDEVTTQEAAGLRAWNGHGAVRPIASQPAASILLMERLDAGRDLTTLPLDAAIREAGRLTRTLAIPPPPATAFATTADRAARIAADLPSAWAGAGRPFSEPRLRQVASLATSLAARDAGRLTTWDLHAENVLWGDRAGWTLIDPMPLVGDPELALAPFLWTRAEEIAGPDHLIDLLEGYVASGGLDRDRTRTWLAVRLADYWLWGLGIGLTIDPDRCRRLLDWLDPTSP